jgi:hypothetical protein
MGKILSVKVREKGVKGECSYEYKNSVNLNDPKLLSLVFKDLKDLYNAPIDKAVKMISKEADSFPFSPQ